MTASIKGQPNKLDSWTNKHYKSQNHSASENVKKHDV